MQGEITETQTCLVYRGNGTEPVPFLSPGVERPPTKPRLSPGAVPLSQIMSRRLICARPDLELRIVIRLLLQYHVGCIPVIDERQRPIGMITKLDLLDQIDATMSSARNGSPLPEDLQARCADEVMMPLAFSLPETATVAHASAMMVAEDTHHVIVTGANDRIVGVVSSRDIVGWLVDAGAP